MFENIKGIGPKTIESLNKLNITNVNELITYYPFRYNKYSPTTINNANEKEIIVINGTIESIPKITYIKKNFNKLSFKLNTGNEIINVTIFNRGFLKQNLKVNMLITVIGKYDLKTNTLTANDIKLKPILKETLEPVYHLNNEIKRANFIKILNTVLNNNYYIPSYVPDDISNKYNFINKMEAIKIIHNPNSLKDYKKSKLFLTYEELFIFMLKINYLKLKNKDLGNNIIKKYDNQKVKEFIKSLPFTLTDDQVKSIEEISNDFNSNKRMNRLLLGDVGSGKTIVSFIVLYMNYLAGYQGMLMAPTEILAYQHYVNIKMIYKNLDVDIEIVTSSTTKKERAEIINKIQNNEVDILIGTHSLLNDELELKNIGLVITDEQHRFGVKQRQKLQQKGRLVDVLYMSATPIPRTLALTIYGDMDISQIKTKPSNRQPVKTKVVKNKDIKEVLNAMLEEIKNNHQVYIVASLIEDENGTNLETVTELYNKINTAFNNKIPIEILHGKMKNKEKDQIMQNFKENKTKILISTTVIEVGIDVSNATMMVIFNAERFGLATLHQLRGRVGRNNLESKCYLISNYEIDRLKILEESNDGFYISEKDFELRGTGDLFGIRQSGEFQFKIANLKTDYKILLQCKIDSEEFLKNNLQVINKYPLQKEIIDTITFID